ncbi:MAG: formate dehydrogenase [Deltaproteobacteria bacterium RBG_16_48_10]|nr:MAG: formate dehydrogenase [Deltaproteobacteria bacterium RBG_16_48_10]
MTEGKSFFIDTTKCTACRGCQIACKQWNKRPAEKTINWGSHQNPRDLSFNTWKLVRFSEIVDDKTAWYFFPDQCRHCVSPPCKEVADGKAKGAIKQDEKTGAVIFNQGVKIKPADFKEIREACPYDIPRFHSTAGVLGKCTMCFDRIKEGMLPACVKTCPTGAMNFGDRKDILEKANKRLAEVKGGYKDAILANPDDVRVIYLLVDDPKKYHKFAVAENTIGITRKMALKRLFQPLMSDLRRMIG